ARRRSGVAASGEGTVRGAAAAVPGPASGAAGPLRGDGLRRSAVRRARVRTRTRAAGRQALIARRRRQSGTGQQMAHRERYLVGLDVGTSLVTVVVGELMSSGTLDIIGIGSAEAKGIRRGIVNHVESAADSIRAALEDAELRAGVEIDSVHLALSGAHVKAFNSRGVVAVAGRNREITRDDVKRAIDAARAVALDRKSTRL